MSGELEQVKSSRKVLSISVVEINEASPDYVSSFGLGTGIFDSCLNRFTACTFGLESSHQPPESSR
jgi:hypothetical protein